jgi:acetaldehyde dehydrogenase (acetylating)
MKNQKLNVAFLGSGRIGIDLLIKAMRSENLYCSMVAGRNYESSGMRLAKEKGVQVSDRGIEAIWGKKAEIDLVFDATSALDHLKHWEILKDSHIKVIDMTPSRIGREIVPTVNLNEVYKHQNINMISCGGQVSIPLVHAVSEVTDEIDYIEIVSSIASKSAGPATRDNIDEYIYATERAILAFSQAKEAKKILILNPAEPPINMQSTVSFLVKNPNMVRIEARVIDMVKKVKKYVPGYELLVGPVQVDEGQIIIMVKIEGLGDCLPPYAGNLDIITSTAIAVAENVALTKSIKNNLTLQN